MQENPVHNFTHRVFLLPPQVKSESSFFFRLGTNAPYLATAKEMRGLPSLCL